MALITWDTARLELGLSGDDQQTIVMQKAEQATAIVLGRIAGYVAREAPAWGDGETMPGGSPAPADPVFSRVQAAILAQTCALYRFRGDDDGREKPDPILRYDLDPIVVRIVAQIEDPTCA